MMDLIKFRAWDYLEERMRYDIGVIEFNGYDNQVDGLAFNYVLDDTGYNEVDNSQSEYYDLQCIELTQYTGFKDKKGNEIYVGDIVKHDPMPNSFYDHYFKIIQSKSGEWRIDNVRGGSVLAFHHDKVEVVGNKYENKDLLEGLR